MSNILKYQNPSSPLLKPWKALEKMNYEAIPDSTFTRDKTGMGSIEYFSADNNNGITYLNGYHKAHPKPGTDVILYDPTTNDQQDVRLDALHFMPKDPIYGALYDVYRYNAKEGDVMHNAKRRYAEDASKYGVKNIDSFDQYFNNEADGLLRNMFIEGTPEYIKSKRYYPDKTQLEKWNAHLMPYINNIREYLETGVKPEYVIEPAIVTAYKKGGKIHIKKKNRGKFTDYCGGKVTEECIAKGKNSKDPKIRKRATFAANARKWKHENGGILKYQNPAEPLPQVLKTAATFPDWLRGTWSYLSGNKDSKLLESQYRPTKETNPNTKYYYRDGLNTDVIKNILGGSDYGKKTRFGENLYYKDFNDVWNRLSAAGGRAERNTDNSQLGAYTIGIGEDNKGRYISYYDKFDWAPPGLPEIFHPYEIYNRIYEDEFNNTQSNLKNITYSGYNPSGNWFFKSGSEQYNNVKR